MKHMAMSVSAAPQPRASAPAYGDDAFVKISDGSEVLAPLNTFLFVMCAAPMVKSSGAVSPAARAPGQGEQGAGDDAADRRRQHHGHRHAGLGGAQGVAALAQRVRHQPQYLV